MNTRLPTYSSFIYGLLTLAKLSLKALGGGPSVLVLVPFNENGIKMQRGEAKYNEECHIALFSLLPRPPQLLASPSHPHPPLAFKLLGSQSPVAFPKQTQQRALMGASSVLAPVGFLSAKLLAQLAVVCFPILLPGTFIASQA